MRETEPTVEVLQPPDWLVPIDKSWVIRMGVLDTLYGYAHVLKQLVPNMDALSTDIQALLVANTQWSRGEVIEVGESGTLFRCLQFAAWKSGEDRQFSLTGTLAERKITNDPRIINLPVSELLKLDGGTSQWATAAVLAGSSEPMPDVAPLKLALTYDARAEWERARRGGQHWELRKDETLRRQAAAFMAWCQTGRMVFTPKHSEDYCFARAFGIISPEEGEARWPSLRGHESDRIEEMEKSLQADVIYSNDHRVIQALAMLRQGDCIVSNPEAVNKSWPQFWDFIKFSQGK